MNRQVPEKIAVIGNGKVARHMIRYFEWVGQPYVHWFRQTSASHASTQPKLSSLARFKHKLNRLFNPTEYSLAAAVEGVAKVLLLISDGEIEKFIKNNQVLGNKTVIHFSGSLYTDLAQGCHPLMTFGKDMYDLSRYQSIPFVVDEGVEFSHLFPLFENPVHTIKAEQKCLYHAMCVMAGNFSQMLWQAVGSELQNLNLPADLMSVYLQQNTENFVANPEVSATGPFVRGDIGTINEHQKALLNHPLAGIYQAFYELNQQNNDAPKRSRL